MCTCTQSRKNWVETKLEKVDSKMTEGVTRFKRNLRESFGEFNFEVIIETVTT